MNLEKSSKDMEGMIGMILAPLLQQICCNLPFFGSSTGADGIAKADVICFDLSKIAKKSSVGEQTHLSFDQNPWLFAVCFLDDIPPSFDRDYNTPVLRIPMA